MTDEEVIEGKRICIVCGTKEKVIRHHVSYKPERIIPLCISCHGFVHSGKIRLNATNLKYIDRFESNVNPEVAFYQYQLALAYAKAHPSIVNKDGEVICCDGKWYYESFRSKGLAWNPCDNCSHNANCIEWGGAR